MSTKYNLIIITTLLLIGGGLIFRFSKQENSLLNESEAQDLRDEFNNAYSKEIEPNGKTIEIDLIAQESKVEIFDGYTTEVWAYNDQVPGPEIRMNLGDTLQVNLENNLPQSTTIHWHGIRVLHGMDGVPGVNQDPIQPGQNFLYEFTPKDAGTYWFHPHIRGSEQLERGLYGVVIVEDPKEPQYSQDVAWVIDDWLIGEDRQIIEQFETPHDIMHDGRWGNVITVDGSVQPSLDAKPGERIRLRLINASNGRVYQPAVQGIGEEHVKVIAIDGLLTKEPQPLTVIPLAPGNRMDLDIQIPSDLTGSIQVLDSFTQSDNLLATIEVIGEPVQINDFTAPQNARIPDWSQASLLPLQAEYVMDLQGHGMMMSGGLQWELNGDSYPNGEVFGLNYDSVNRIKFTNGSRRLHPMHIHGMFFKVIARNGKAVQEDFFRDTVLVEPREEVEIALVPFDKGSWALHCHIQEHAEAGMMTLVEVN